MCLPLSADKATNNLIALYLDESLLMPLGFCVVLHPIIYRRYLSNLVASLVEGFRMGLNDRVALYLDERLPMPSGFFVVLHPIIYRRYLSNLVASLD